MKTPSADPLFDGKQAIVREIYEKLLAAVGVFGKVKIEPHKTSIHLVNCTAFAGVAVRKDHLVLTIKSDLPMESDRIFKSERVSRNRYHHEIRLASPLDVNKELVAWLKAGWKLSA